MPDYYEILNLKEGASQQEIKRAYFRLIREHTPDSDPEGFMKIREAYESLKSGSSRKSGPSFSSPADPVAAVIYKSTEEALSLKNMVKVMELTEFGAKSFPNEPYFLYYLQIAQRRTGHSGKAVKTGEKLYALDKENPWYSKELTLSYLERGYIKKAITQFKKCWSLKIRDAEFTAMMCHASHNRNYYSFAGTYALRLMQEKKAWAKDELEDGIALCSCLAEYIDMSIENADLMALTVLEFLEKNFPELNSETAALLIGLLGQTAVSHASEETLDRVLAACEAHRNELDDDQIEVLEFIKTFRKTAKLAQAPYISDEIKRLIFLRKSDCPDAQIYEFTCLDYMLILMKTPEHYKLQLFFLENQFPEAYALRKQFFDLFKNPNALEKKMDEYRIRYRKMSSNFTGGLFYKMFPDERKKSIPEAADNTFRELLPRRKFARALVGRNDPCPCGSGKKFKKCCMGKGIYD